MRKTFTKLSIAVIALLAGSIPCFAQTQSIAYAADAKSAAVGSGLELTLNRSSVASPLTGLVVVEPKSVADTKHVTSPTLTAAAFKTSDHFVKAENNFSASQTIWSTNTTINSKPQFRIDDESNAQTSRNRVTFVPSRGPKVPW